MPLVLVGHPGPRGKTHLAPLNDQGAAVCGYTAADMEADPLWDRKRGGVPAHLLCRRCFLPDRARERHPEARKDPTARGPAA